MKLRYKVSINNNNLKTEVLFVAKEVVSKAIQDKTPMIIDYAKSLLKWEIDNSKTISSLLTGKLKADFGLTDDLAKSAVEEITNHLVSNITILPVEKKGGYSLISFILRLSPLPDFYKTISSGSYYSDGYYVRSRGADGQIDWLEWLLTRGTEIIIDDYYVWYTTDKIKSKIRLKSSVESRSGMALMLPNTKLRTGTGGFRVDPEFAGTIDSNFITDMLQTVIFYSKDYILENLL
jgi:hypothetical protein